MGTIQPTPHGQVAHASSSLPSTASPPSIGATLELHTRAARRSIANTRIAGIAVLSALTIWFAWLHSQISQLDAESLSLFAQEQALAELPSAAQSVRARLEASAPELVDRCAARLLETPALVREKLEAQAELWLERAVGELELGFSGHLAEHLALVRSEVDQRYPGLDQREQLRSLARDCVREYGEHVRSAMALHATESAPAFRELTAELERLSRGENLSPEDRVKRELLATLVHLAPRLEMPEPSEGTSLSFASTGETD